MDDTTMTGPGPTFLSAPFHRQTWAEALYCLVAFGTGTAGFVFAVTALSVSAGLLVTLVGFPLLALSLVGARGFGAGYRGLARGLLGLDVSAPRATDRRRGLRGYLSDRAGWRAMLFLIVHFPVAIAELVATTVAWSIALGGITYAAWRPFLPLQHDDKGGPHRGASAGTSYFFDTWQRILLVEAVGLVLLFVGPWVVHGFVKVDRMLIRGLLGPTTMTERMRELETTRALAVDDSAAALRRIERDLHDGAQARLVALAMSLGMAKEELEGDDPEVAVARARALVSSAHQEAKGTIVDLRDLARGIHPPALDNGLDEALSTLVARSPVPATLHVSLPQRPSPAVETIAYFCTAELLTNVAKHSGARHAAVSVVRGEHRLVLRVEDDGRGGATVGGHGGSGLAGLADRLATVDGTLAVSSPDGGPTTVTVEVPL
ncbi:MAG TPA: sensor domain-containing protein [Mycobacteriales bacterium]|nr:sensor domain-containing protein [Mycobacteriales bacterium]